MKFVFWQNVLSIHQATFIAALAERHSVTLVAEQAIYNQRKAEGWNVPQMGNAKVVVSPDDDTIKQLIDEPNAEHVFSGIDAYPTVYRALKYAISRGKKFSIMAEPFNMFGLKGYLRSQKYRMQFKRYGKHISRLFAIGSLGIENYKKIGFPTERTYAWGYFTYPFETRGFNSRIGGKPRLIFVGKIDKRKNILALTDCIKQYTDRIESFTIIGTGNLEQKLLDRIKGLDNVRFLGAKSNIEIQPLIAQSDLLILPSIFDGWGAVVNEALTQGTRVLCSTACGTSVLLDGMVRGESFNLADMNSVIGKWIDKGGESGEDRLAIRKWALTNLSGVAAAEYFCKVFVGEEAKAPWLN